MKRALQQFAAVLFGVMLVTAGALGAAFTQPGVHDLDDAADELVPQTEAVGVIGVTGAIAVGTAGAWAYDEFIASGETDADKLAKADALETKQAIYDSASIQRENNDILQTAYGNYLNDTESIALMTAKNAYIRALENGSAESVARNEAKRALANYYVTKQENLLASWNTTLTVFNSSRFTAENTTGINAGYVNVNRSTDTGSSFHSIGTSTVTLINGSTADIQDLTLYVTSQTSYNDNGPTPFHFLNPSMQRSGTEAHVVVENLYVKPPETDVSSRLSFGNFNEYQNKWNRIEQQHSQVSAQIDTFINNTYSAYQRGEINESDLVDPYLGMREYAPENASQFQSWTLSTLSAMGLNSPANLSNVGQMTVLTGGQSYQGILMSDENPAGGFTVGNTYNATELNGSQFVAPADGGMVELEGEFTLESAETAQGTTIEKNESITYRNVTYETANMTEFKNLQQDLNTLQAEINARQQSLRNSGGGGLLPDFGLGLGGGLGVPVTLLLLAGCAVLVLGRD